MQILPPLLVSAVVPSLLSGMINICETDNVSSIGKRLDNSHGGKE